MPYAVHDTNGNVVSVFAQPQDMSLGAGWVDDGDPALAAYSFSRQKNAVVSSASSVCATLTQQVVPDSTRLNAYLNANAFVQAGGGKAPSADPIKTIFSQQAALYGFTPDQFATVVSTVATYSMQLSTIMGMLSNAATAAKGSDDLTAAISAFEAGISALITSLVAAGLTVTAPPPIAIGA